jgi:glycolate oxidase iron-sulfur subunit
VAVFPNRALMHTVADLLRLAQSGPLAAFVVFLRRRGWLPGFAARGLALTPPLEPRGARSLGTLARRLPAGASLERRGRDLVFHPAGTPKARVAFFTSCVMDVMFPRINHEAVRLLVLAGAEVTVPGAQTCCGALHAHSGLRWDAMRLATLNVHAFSGPFEFVVTDSAGCGAALRDSGHLLAECAVASAAGRFAAKVRDVSEVLSALGMPPAATPATTPAAQPPASRPLRIAYHDPCHLAHAQKVRSQPRALLAALPGVQLVDLPNSDWCCGSAGVYNLTHEPMADAQLAHKLDSIASVDPDIVVASNPGCLLHMARGVRERGSGVRVLHLVEVLALAHRAPGEAAPVALPVTAAG